MNKYAVETHNISKSYAHIRAIDDVSIKIENNIIHSIIGENGAGKTTLMSMLTNVVAPDSGDIFIHGNKVDFKSPIDAAKHGVGMVYQEFMLATELSALDNIMLGFEETKGIFIDQAEVRKKVEHICAEYKFNIPLDTLVKDLPVALQQQTEIVKVLYRGADIIIMDEPTSTLTPQGIEGLFDAMRMLKEDGRTIIFITHKLEEVMNISDRISVLRDGQYVGTYNVDDVNEQKLADMMVGRSVILKANKPISYETDNVILRVNNLSVKDNNGIERVRDVNLNIHEGEIVGIAGVAGSGQQYLVEALFGLRRPETGSEIIFKGEEITNNTPLMSRQKGIGYVPQDRFRAGSNIISTIWENTIMGYHRAHGFNPNYLINRKEAFSFTEKVVKDFDVKTDDICNLVGSLSGGNIQKLIVGREFLQDNSLLIVEDPTRGIDVGAIEYIWERMIKFTSQKTAILLVSHELNEVMQLSDHIYVMFDGNLLYGGKNKELTANQIGILMAGGSLKHEFER